MSYEPTIWVNDQEPALNAENLNKLEQAVEAASTPAWESIIDKPSTFAPTIGATETTAAAGNHDHAVTADTASGLEAAETIQALAVALSARIKALEDASQTP